MGFRAEYRDGMWLKFTGGMEHWTEGWPFEFTPDPPRFKIGDHVTFVPKVSIDTSRSPAVVPTNMPVSGKIDAVRGVFEDNTFRLFYEVSLGEDAIGFSPETELKSVETMIAEFKRRLLENYGKEIDNSKLYAGQPMYYYCKGCCILVAVRSEDWSGERPPRYCDACEELVKLGIMERLEKVP